MLSFVMAWSPARRANARRFEVHHPGDYATLNSNQSRDSTRARYGTSLVRAHWSARNDLATAAKECITAVPYAGPATLG